PVERDLPDRPGHVEAEQPRGQSAGDVAWDCALPDAGGDRDLVEAEPDGCVRGGRSGSDRRERDTDDEPDQCEPVHLEPPFARGYDPLDATHGGAARKRGNPRTFGVY